MPKAHSYDVSVTWTGNRNGGTTGYRSYERDHDVGAPGRPTIPGSSDPAFRGDPSRWAPEHLLVVALSQCQMLWYLSLCATAGVVVTSYHDAAQGTMLDTGDSGHFTEVVLRPRVEITPDSSRERALALHEAARAACYIANSVNFPVRHEPSIAFGPAS